MTSPKNNRADLASIGPSKKRKFLSVEQWRHAILFVMALGVILIPYHFFWRAAAQATLSPQSLKMLKSGMQPTLLQAVTTTTVWPPGYPLVLFLGHQLHIPFPWINLTLLYVTFTIVFLFLRRFNTALGALAGVLGLTLFSFHYYNYAQFTSEALVVPLSLLILLFLDNYNKQDSPWNIWIISFIAAMAFLSRYQILAWLSPVIILVLLRDRRFSYGKRLRHSALFLSISMMPVSLYMLMNRFRTGYFTGMSRLGGYDARPPLPTEGEAAYFATQVSFIHNVKLTFKTYFLDFFSLTSLATHRANRLPYHALPVEILTLGVFLAALILASFFFIQHHHLRRTNNANYSTIDTLVLAVLFYIIITIALWTIGNNDPIYTRFLYPSYTPIVILFLAITSAIFKETRRLPFRAPFLLTIILILMINTIKLFYLY